MSIMEIVGYAGSLLVALSLSMRSIVALRWINLVGATLFCLYGFAIEAWPVCAVNLYIALMDLYYLVEMHRGREQRDAG